MALTRLRNILGCEHLVRVESTAKLITRVNKNIQKRAQKFTAEGQNPAPYKGEPYCCSRSAGQAQIGAFALLICFTRSAI